ncbi:TRAP transporter substrate-binding protein [Thaumasiovibrio subtropicus]|uniref:TRAP transporter substrate-binding protein n=1 Tax=Thaumasiovibrio subtropicus TaxID=1891207 RepID=UPI00131EAAD3|nr:TRAP transporter substrate-binding protein [Thaumasiovibrio subtropicus]
MRAVGMLLLVLSLLGCSEQSPTSSPVEYEWRLSTAWPTGFPGVGDAPRQLAERVNVASNGRFVITVYGAGEIVPAFDLFKAVSNRAVEMGHSSAYYWQDELPAAAFFSAVPFGMNATEMTSWLYEADGMALWQELYQPYGVLPFPGGNSGPQMGGWFNRPIESMEDWLGLKMRIPGFGAGVVKSVGGIPISLAATDIPDAFQNNLLDAIEWIGPYNDLAFGLYKMGRYYYYPAWHEPSTQMEFIVNQSAFDALPDDLQQLLVDAMDAVNNQMQAHYLVKNQQALEVLLKEHGVVLRAFPPEVLQSLQQHTKRLLLSLAGHDPQFHKIYMSYSAHTGKLRKLRSFVLSM